MMIEYYSIQIDIQDEEKLLIGVCTDIIELSKQGRLNYSGNGIKLNSLDLAERLEERYLPFLKNKYGNETKTYIIHHKYNATPVYGPKAIKLIESNSLYAENVLKTQKPPKIIKEKSIKNGWIIIVKKEGLNKFYAMPIKNKNKLEITTDKKKAKIYQRLNSAKKYAEKINKIKDLTALIINIENN